MVQYSKTDLKAMNFKDLNKYAKKLEKEGYLSPELREALKAVAKSSDNPADAYASLIHKATKKKGKPLRKSASKKPKQEKSGDRRNVLNAMVKSSQNSQVKTLTDVAKKLVITGIAAKKKEDLINAILAAEGSGKKSPTRKSAKKSPTRKSAKKSPTRKSAKKSPTRKSAKKSSSRKEDLRSMSKTSTKAGTETLAQIAKDLGITNIAKKNKEILIEEILKAEKGGGKKSPRKSIRKSPSHKSAKKQEKSGDRRDVLNAMVKSSKN